MVSEIKITRKYLRDNPNHVFVFGDNLKRMGMGGAAKLRDMPNTYGFITKKYPGIKDEHFYKLDEYKDVFYREKRRLKKEIENNPDKTYLISRVGSGLANRFGIWDFISKELKYFIPPNVIFLWNTKLRRI